MKKYFYSNGQDKEGPVTLEELKQKDISPKTLIWYEGLGDWKEAESVDELKEIFELSPPPISSEKETLSTVPLNDISLENNSVSTKSNSTEKETLFDNLTILKKGKSTFNNSTILWFCWIGFLFIFTLIDPMSPSSGFRGFFPFLFFIFFTITIVVFVFKVIVYLIRKLF